LLWVPVLILITALFALGIGLGGSALGTFRRDIVFVIPFALQFLMLATPIIYPLSKVPQQFQALVSLNPMVGVVEGFRSVVLHGATPDLGLLAVSLTVTALVWLISWPFFRFTSGYYADAL
jgi:lipopolysaccharide transport system permease protein